MTTNHRRPTITVVLLAAAAAAAAARAWPRITHPSLWGEDGPVFLAGAREHGPAAVLEPYVGYLHVLPRLIAAVLEPLPLTWQPGLYAAAAAAVGFSCAALSVSTRLGWLLPTWPARAVLLGLLIAAPARAEVTGNIANLIFVGVLGLLLLALADDPTTRRGRAAETTTVAVLGLSGPLGAAVLPVFAARVARTRSRHSITIAAAAAVAAVVQWSLLAVSPRVDEHNGSLTNTGPYLGRRLLPTWFYGDSRAAAAAMWHNSAAATAAVIGTVVLTAAVLTAAWRFTHRPTATALLTTAVVAAVLPAVAYRTMPTPPTAQRHLLLPLAVVAVLLVGSLAPYLLYPDRRRVAAVGVAAVALSAAAGVRADWRVTPWPERPLGPTAVCLQQHRGPCPIPINPVGWRPRGDVNSTLDR